LNGKRKNVDSESSQPLNCSTSQTIKKPGGENEFSPRVEVNGWNYEKAP
jgi:hypothetical protein